MAAERTVVPSGGMIRNMSEMLEGLRQAEARRLDLSNIRHAPTIGAMYEGLTREMLDRAVPRSLDLRIVSGFVVDGMGSSSGQLDCMLVRGDGMSVPYVDGVYQWHVKDVLAVIEVKKNLFGEDLDDAFHQLKNVSDTFSSWVQNGDGEGEFNLGASMRAYADCVGDVAPPPDEWERMDVCKHLILHTIMSDQLGPVRIMLGYGGYSTEGGLRRGFIDFLEKRIEKSGYGPPTIPNLIVADSVSLVKLSGHPYHAPLTSSGWWPIVASSHVNPTLLLMELIWTRISYLHPAPDVFGDDLETERLSPLLDAKPMENPDRPGAYGWKYNYRDISAKDLAGEPHRDWEPVVLDEEQFVVVNRLCGTTVSTKDSDLLAFLTKAGRDPHDFFSSLVETCLVARDGDDLKLTTMTCAVAVLPDGRCVAADNNTGRLTRWIDREISRNKLRETSRPVSSVVPDSEFGAAHSAGGNR